MGRVPRLRNVDGKTLRLGDVAAVTVTPTRSQRGDSDYRVFLNPPSSSRAERRSLLR